MNQEAHNEAGEHTIAYVNRYAPRPPADPRQVLQHRPRLPIDSRATLKRILDCSGFGQRAIRQLLFRKCMTVKLRSIGNKFSH